MFAKQSRYARLPDEVTMDARGRQLPSKSLRLLPQVTGTFEHTIDDNDRLDHLASRYYRQPRKWWRLCDANVEFLDPQALLGKTPISTQRFRITFSGPEPPLPWAVLYQHLCSLVGVEDVWLDVDALELTVTFNQLNLQASDLAQALEHVGLTVTQPQRLERAGKRLVIPPDAMA